MSASIYEAIESYLKGAASLAGLTGVYFLRPPKGQGEAFPYLIFSPIGATVQLNLASSMDCAEVHFSVLSQDDATAWSLGRAAYDALWPRNNPTLTFADGAETTRVPLFRDRVREQANRGPGNKNVWVYSFGYQWMISNVD